MAMTPDELIDTSMMLIVHSGDARAAAFHALQEAKAGNYEEAKKLMAESQEKALEAHHIQTGLLTDEGNGEGPQVNLLLVHAQDHLMTSMLAQELIAELIELHEKRQTSKPAGAHIFCKKKENEAIPVRLFTHLFKRRIFSWQTRKKAQLNALPRVRS